jgi:hypothetical protein
VSTPRTIGSAWYSPESWKRLVALPEAHIEKSYRDFVSTFENIVSRSAVQGITVEKMSIDIDRMIAWCHRNGYEVDAKGRAVYGAMLMCGGDHDAPVVDKTRVVQ